MRQRKLTVVVPIDPLKVDALEALLQPIGDDVMNDTTLPIRLSASTHFARLVILKDPAKPRLLFSACYAGPVDAYVAELVTHCAAGLDRIFRHSPAYAGGAWQHPDTALAFVRKHDVGWNTYVIAFPHTPPRDILFARQLRKAANALLDHPAAADLTAALFPNGLRLAPPPPSSDSTAVNPLIEAIDRLLVGKSADRTNVIIDTHPGLVRMEDRVVQNQMTVYSPNKPSVLRRLLLRGVLLGAQANVRLSGAIGGLPMIHFANWSILDGGDMLLFESNYDGTWEKYIDDFIDHSYPGLDAIWSNGTGYPAGGARNTEAFKDQIRSHQFPAQVFYSAYPDCTVQNIVEDLALAATLRPLADSEALRLFLSGSHAQRL